jgi:hypothetical protein
MPTLAGQPARLGGTGGTIGVPPEHQMDLIKPPVPEDRIGEFYKALQEAREKSGGDPPDWLVNNLITRYFGESLEQAYGGGEKLFGRGRTGDERMQGASDIFRGGMKFAAPFVLPEALLATPAATLTGLGVGMATGAGTEALGEKLGWKPGLQALAGDVVGFGAGGAAARPENLEALGRGFDRLDFGSERGSISGKRAKGPPPTVRDLMESPLDLPGKGLTHDLGQALQDIMKKGFRLPRFAKGSDPEPYRERALEMMPKDVQWALDNVKEAGEWYDKTIDAMENRMAKNRPEFKDPTKRALFKYLLGITSNGIDPQANFDAAMKGWDIYKRDGKFNAYDRLTPSEFDPTKPKGLTMRANSYDSSIEALNQLIKDQGGEAGAVEWLQTEHPFSELRKYDPKIAGAKSYEERLGSYIFGEKVGSFGSNLNGVHTELTADKWWSRTWNRWMGTVMATKADGTPEIDEKTGLPMLQDDPRNFGERELMRDTAARVAKDLGLNVDELQALLWYTEQALYRQHGIDASSVDYDQASRIHFEKRGAAQPGKNVGNRPPPAARGPTPQRGAPQRSAAKAPAGVPGGRAQGARQGRGQD